ncbi:MAG TPA: AtpZ/AtpI family protein [Candidatus Methylomirabilis sp.]|nr:AtpZ/AtpI family protein [Candidatus Methylomirabilis sp.]
MAPGSERRSRGQGAQLANLGTLLFACVAVGLAIGYAVDRWLGTAPWCLLLGLGFGISAAAVNFFRALKALNRTDGPDGDT